MRYFIVAVPLTVLMTIFSTFTVAQSFDWGGIIERGVNEAIRSINTPNTPSPAPILRPSTPTPSQPARSSGRPSATAQSVDARITDNMLGNPAEFRTFFNQLKQAVAVSDKRTLAKMMQYPLRISDNHLQIRTEQDFITHYNRIFTPSVIASVNAQSYADLFVRDQGVMAGRTVWFTGVCIDRACNRSTPKVVSVFGE